MEILKIEEGGVKENDGENNILRKIRYRKMMARIKIWKRRDIKIMERKKAEKGGIEKCWTE